MAKDYKNKISFRINEIVYAIDFEHILWMYVGVYNSYEYDYTVIKYCERNKEYTIRFDTEEQARSLVTKFETYCRSKYEFCDDLCILPDSDKLNWLANKLLINEKK